MFVSGATTAAAWFINWLDSFATVTAAASHFQDNRPSLSAAKLHALAFTSTHTNPCIL